MTRGWIAILALWAASPPVDACRCAQRDLAEYFEAAGEVVTARLLAASTLEQEPPRLALQFELIAPAFKSARAAAVGETFSYSTSASSAACGIAPEEGAVYVLFATASADPEQMQIDSCSGSRVLLRAGAETPEGFQDVPPRFVAQQLNALAGLDVLRRIAAAQPDPNDLDNKKLVGLLDVSGFSHVPRVPLFASPERDAEVIAELQTYDSLAAREVGYETLAAEVFARTDGWSKLRTAEGEYGWLPEEYAGTFYPYDQIPLRRLAYLPVPWHRFVWPSPGAGLPIRVLPAVDGSEQPVEIIQSTQVGGSPWFRVTLLRSSPCEGGSGDRGAGGWIPAYRQDGAPVAWFYSRGC